MEIIVVLIIAAIIFTLITFIKPSSSKPNKKNHNSDTHNKKVSNASYPSEFYKLGATVTEGERRLQILNESSQIIENTKNIDTLLSRRNVIDDNLDWFLQKEREGSQYKLKVGASEMKIRLKERINEMICRIISDEVAEYKLTMEKMKSERAKENRTKKIFERINDFQTHLIKDTENYENCQSILKNMHFDVEEAFGNL